MVDYAAQFEQWWTQLSMEEQAAIDVTVEVCRKHREEDAHDPHEEV